MGGNSELSVRGGRDVLLRGNSELGVGSGRNVLLLLELPGGRVHYAGTEAEISSCGWTSWNGLGVGRRHANGGGGCGGGSHLLEELLMSEILLLTLRRVLLQQRQLGLLVVLLSLGFDGLLEFEDFEFVLFG